MEHKEDFFEKTPFYMTYPIQNLYMAEMEYERDMERMKELYPKEVVEILKLIEARCDELETEGSRLYDENPDRLMMEQEACRLYHLFLDKHPEPMPIPQPMPRTEMRRFSLEVPEEFKDMMSDTEVNQVQLEMQQRHREGSWLWDLFQVIFNDEVYRRRCRHRRCKRWW